MSYKQPSYLKQIWWTIKWMFIRNKKTVKVEEPRFSHPPMDLRMKYEREEDLSDGALD